MGKQGQLYKNYLETLTEQDFDRLEDRGEFLKDIDVTDSEFLEMEKLGETPIESFYNADGSFRIGEDFEENEIPDNLENKPKNKGEIFIFIAVFALIAIFMFLQNT